MKMSPVTGLEHKALGYLIVFVILQVELSNVPVPQPLTISLLPHRGCIDTMKNLTKK